MHCSLTKHVSDFVQLMADEDAKAAGRSSFTARSRASATFGKVVL
jgi:hypothetical protein